MRHATLLLATGSAFALAACGQSDNTEFAGNDPGLADPGVYDTTQPAMENDGATATDDDFVGTEADTPPSPLPDALTGNIIEVANEAGEFSTFVNLVQEAGLTMKLEGPGPFTVFAPTDDAFAALPEGATDELLQPANRGDLVSLLEYHILPGNVTAGEISADGPAPATVDGRSLKLTSAEDGSVMAGEAKVVTADIKASNGVIHIVDKVLTPPAS